MTNTKRTRPRPIGELLDAAPPTDPDSEQALLAAVLVDPSNLDRVAEIVCPDDFGDADLGRLFEALLILHDGGLPIGDARVLVPELARLNVPEAVRTPAAIFGLINEGRAHVAHAKHYARAVKRASTLRRQHGIALDLLAAVGAHEADPEHIGRWLDSQLQGIGLRVSDPPRRLDDLAGEIIEDLRQADTTRPRGLMTGLRFHDETAGGWQPGELIILAARPGIGKTALALQVAQHNAMRERPVLFVSLEMSGRELVGRVLCGLSGVDSRRLRLGRVAEKHVASIEQAANQLHGIPLRIWAPPAAELPRIRALAKQETAAGGLALLVVDYIGLVRPDDRTRPRHEQVAAVSAGLKALAKELSCPVLALCQLNREADGAEPRLSHLRESGAIEQDADLVLLLHRAHDKENEAHFSMETEFIIAKHRHGETGRCTLRWIPERTRFEDSTHQEDFGEYGGGQL